MVKVSDLEKLTQKIAQEKEKAQEKLKQLMKKEFMSSEGAREIMNQFAQTLKYHQIQQLKIRKTQLSSKKKKSKNSENQSSTIYQITASIKLNNQKVTELEKRAGRFILATNRLNKIQFSSNNILTKYKEQQAPERGFGSLGARSLSGVRVPSLGQHSLSGVRVPWLRKPQQELPPAALRSRTAFLKIPYFLLIVFF